MCPRGLHLWLQFSDANLHTVFVNYVRTSIHEWKTEKVQPIIIHNKNYYATFYATLLFQFNCCGINGYFDWAAAGIVDPPPPCSVNTRGCEKALQSYFWVLGGIAIGVLVIEVSFPVFF